MVKTGNFADNSIFSTSQQLYQGSIVDNQRHKSLLELMTRNNEDANMTHRMRYHRNAIVTKKRHQNNATIIQSNPIRFVYFHCCIDDFQNIVSCSFVTEKHARTLFISKKLKMVRARSRSRGRAATPRRRKAVTPRPKSK